MDKCKVTKITVVQKNLHKLITPAKQNPHVTPADAFDTQTVGWGVEPCARPVRTP